MHDPHDGKAVSDHERTVITPTRTQIGRYVPISMILRKGEQTVAIQPCISFCKMIPQKGEPT